MASTLTSKPVGRSTPHDEALGDLYRLPMQATRSGSLYNAFPYPTKISPEAIALFIATHTSPGETVFDGFAGSGTTGLAALLCANPPDELKAEAVRLGLPVQWGPRKAVLCEIGVLGSFIARVLCSPPDPEEFRQAAEQLLADASDHCGWLYQTTDPSGQTGTIRYTIWSDTLRCPSCSHDVPLWDACVSRDPANIDSMFHCPHCGHEAGLNSITRKTETVNDGILRRRRTVRHRRPVWVYGTTKGRNWSRAVNASDESLLKRVAKEPIPGCVPEVKIPWGDLYRAGYHEGMTHMHHFYTRRNLIAFASMWEQVDRHPKRLREALRFLLLSYNAAHATIMTRVVAKKGQKDLVVTSAQPGVLYVSGLPVEKDLFSGLRRKLDTIADAFAVTHGHPGLVDVRNSSCLSVDLPAGSVDYVFTDPPFGGNIPYAEVNFLNEAWLGRPTNTKEEVIVSPHQGKTVEKYQSLLSRALQEANRLLRKEGNATLVFHSASAQVWNALRNACEDAGFGITLASVLDKTQGSFKQVTAAGAVKGDPLLLLTKTRSCLGREKKGVWAVAKQLLREAVRIGDPAETTPHRLYSRLVGYYLSRRQNVPLDAAEFYGQFAERLAVDGHTAA